MENENPHQKISFLLQLIDQVLEQHKELLHHHVGG